MNAWEERFELLLRAALNKLPDNQELAPDLDTSAAGLTSFAAVELLLNIEATYAISIPADRSTFASLGTPAAIWSLVCTVRESQ